MRTKIRLLATSHRDWICLGKRLNPPFHAPPRTRSPFSVYRPGGHPHATRVWHRLRPLHIAASYLALELRGAAHARLVAPSLAIPLRARLSVGRSAARGTRALRESDPWCTVCERVGAAMVRQRRLNAYLGFPVASTHVGAGWMWPDFRLSRNGDGAARLSSRNVEANAVCRALSEKDRFGGLPVHDEHVPHPMHTPQRLRVELEQRISTHEETLGKAVRNAARRMNASTI